LYYGIEKIIVRLFNLFHSLLVNAKFFFSSNTFFFQTIFVRNVFSTFKIYQIEVNRNLNPFIIVFFYYVFTYNTKLLIIVSNKWHLLLERDSLTCSGWVVMRAQSHSPLGIHGVVIIENNDLTSTSNWYKNSTQYKIQTFNFHISDQCIKITDCDNGISIYSRTPIIQTMSRVVRISKNPDDWYMTSKVI
jgi:hypothetical protein